MSTHDLILKAAGDILDVLKPVYGLIMLFIPFFLWGIYRQSVRQTKLLEDMAADKYFEKRGGK